MKKNSTPKQLIKMIDEKITKKLEEFSIEELSFSSGFIKRSKYKISGLAFILGFFRMINNKVNTVESWAGQISRIIGIQISVQSLQEKLQFRHIKLSEVLLKEVLSRQVFGKKNGISSSKLLTFFNRVFIEDSTCVTLPEKLVAFFPGTVNQKGPVGSTARVQCRMELKSGECEHVELQGYRDNDQKFAPQILGTLKKGDLVIRDMGYWVLSVFRLIIEKKAFFLSRFCYGTYIYDLQTKEQIDLYGKLRCLRRQGINVLDINVLLGKEEQLPVRLVAIKAPQNVEQQRKRKMRKDKLDKRSKDYLEMMGWTIFVTNIPKKILKPNEMLEVYGYRWRIEIIFKCWKSRLRFADMFKKKSMAPGRVYITFYLLLIWITLFFVKWYNFFLFQVFKQTGKILSLFKFATYVAENFEKEYSSEQLMEEINYLARYCSQNKRTVKSSIEKIYVLNFT